MLRSLKYKIGQIYLVTKIFLRLVPFHLYWRVIFNACRNILHFYCPSSAVLGLTYRCQCKCVHCSAGLYLKDIKNELTTKEWLALLDGICALGVPRINISGGEALLREDIFEIIEYASKKFIVILESNGQLLTKENVKKLKETKISCVAVSIDSYDCVKHDKLRNLQGCFEKAVEGISNVVESGIPCLLSTYITSERANQKNIKELTALAKKLRVLAVRIMPPRPVGSFSCHIDSLLTKEEEKNIYEIADSSISYYKGMPAPKLCGIFIHATFYISPYGEVQPCPFMPLSFGNVRSGSLPSILNNMWNHSIFHSEYKDCLVLHEDFREKYLNKKGKESVFPIEIRTER